MSISKVKQLLCIDNDLGTTDFIPFSVRILLIEHKERIALTSYIQSWQIMTFERNLRVSHFEYEKIQ